jgi:PIN domain nuclease of toxin-antitoxin system
VKLLLDTHVWLWFVHGDDSLPRRFLDAIRDPGNSVSLSVVSAWEVQIKATLGKLELRLPINTFLDDAVLRFDLLDVSLRHIRALGTLPSHHRDPFDRMLVAQAVADGLTMMTVDPLVRVYGIDCLAI